MVMKQSEIRGFDVWHILKSRIILFSGICISFSQRLGNIQCTIWLPVWKQNDSETVHLSGTWKIFILKWMKFFSTTIFQGTFQLQTVRMSSDFKYTCGNYPVYSLEWIYSIISPNSTMANYQKWANLVLYSLTMSHMDVMWLNK